VALRTSLRSPIDLVRRLYRFAMERPLKIPVKVTTGNRETWVRRGVFYVNPNNRTTLQPGWHDIVSLSLALLPSSHVPPP